MPRCGGTCTAEIEGGVYMVADSAEERGIATFCNDNTVEHNAEADETSSTDTEPNAKLVWTMPHDAYLENWKRGLNNGSGLKLWAELTRVVGPDEEIFVRYGKSKYWQRQDYGTQISKSIVVEDED